MKIQPVGTKCIFSFKEWEQEFIELMEGEMTPEFDSSYEDKECIIECKSIEQGDHESSYYDIRFTHNNAMVPACSGYHLEVIPNNE